MGVELGLLPGAAGVPSASRRLAGPSSRVAPLRATRMLAGGMRMRRPSGPGNPAFAYRRDESPFPWGIGIDRILSQIVPRPAAVFERDVGAPVGSCRGGERRGCELFGAGGDSSPRTAAARGSCARKGSGGAGVGGARGPAGSADWRGWTGRISLGWHGAGSEARVSVSQTEPCCPDRAARVILARRTVMTE